MVLILNDIMLRYLRRNWLPLALGSSLALSLYTNLSRMKDDYTTQSASRIDAPPSEIDKVLKRLEKIEMIVKDIDELKTRFDTTDKKIKGMTRLKSKFGTLEKMMMMSFESCGNQITGLSDNLGAMEGVYRQSLDDLDDKAKEHDRLLEDHDKQLRALENQSMMLLLKGFNNSKNETDSRSVLSDS